MIDKVNKEGGINGRNIELVIADRRGDAKESVLIAEKFVADPTIIAQIGDFSSSSTMAAAPVYEQAKMVQISPTASHQDWTKKGEFMFRVVATQGYEGPYNARWAVSDLKKKKIATIYIKRRKLASAEAGAMPYWRKPRSRSSHRRSNSRRGSSAALAGECGRDSFKRGPRLGWKTGGQ